MKSTRKIILALFAGNLFVVLLFSAAIYYFLNKYSYVDFYESLETRANIAARYNLGSDRLSAEALRRLRDEHLVRLSQENEYVIPVSGAHSLAHAADSLKLDLEFLKSIHASGHAILKKGNIFFTGVKYQKDGTDHLVIVSAENYYASHHMTFLGNLLLVSLIFLLLITVALSHYFTRSVFTPIRRITDNVRKISTGNMHLRLEENEGENEIGTLIVTFNDLLNRLETAFETQKNFISNASHELGTPLTTIIGEADLALLKERSPAEYREAMEKIMEQADRLDQITKSLLFLAQTGYSHKRITFAVLRIDELVWEVKQNIDRLNPQNKIEIDISLFPENPKKLTISANRQLMGVALANILNNACKYSNNQPVTVSIGASDEEVVILVRDRGIGIPAGELAFIFDPFFRASNAHTFEGFGIGLPLSRNIVRLHQGNLTVSSQLNRGTDVQISIPIARVF